MKKIMGLTVAALLIMGLVGGGTWAYFSDTESSTNNTFTAGTLNLTPSIAGTGPAGKVTVSDPATGDGIDVNVAYANLVPGDSGTITWTLENSGSIDGDLTILSTVTFTENGAGSPETKATTPTNDNGGNGDLDEYIGVTLTQKIGSAAATYLLGDATNKVPISGLEAALDAVTGGASPTMQEDGVDGDTIIYVLTWEIAADVEGAGVDVKFGTADDVAADDNVLQSDTVDIDITFTLDQTTS
ncbi:MAG: TasA family protein [Dehalococcoidales bacterium]|nr:TasA family protein [Dehalococcoidales bacterium]